MKSRLVLAILTLLSANALAQQEAKFEVAVGIGTDVIYSAIPFKNDRNLSASICYGLSDQWGVVLYLGQQQYSLDRLGSHDESFLGGSTPEISKTATSLLVGGRYFIPTESKVANLYLLLALGYANASSSAEGFYFSRYGSHDTLYYRIASGRFLEGLLSLGAQTRPFASIDLFAELQMRGASKQEHFLEAIAARMGVGITF